MEKLYKRRCEPCGLGAPVVTEEEANDLLISVPAWKKEFHDGVEKLVREFFFIEFTDAFNFTYKIASLAEREQAWFKLVESLMADFNAEMEKEIKSKSRQINLLKRQVEGLNRPSIAS